MDSVIGEVVMVNSIQNFFSAIEPMLRKVVRRNGDSVLNIQLSILMSQASDLYSKLDQFYKMLNIQAHATT